MCVLHIYQMETVDFVHVRMYVLPGLQNVYGCDIRIFIYTFIHLTHWPTNSRADMLT